MADKVGFTLVSPEQLVLNEMVDMVVVPGENGDFGVLPDHAALISSLRPGLIYVHNGDKIVHQIFISGGVANVNEEGCTILAEECIFLDDLKKQDLETQLSDIQIDLELARSEEDRKDLERTVTITMAKLELVRNLMKH
jgi:F-type H+-transporting ATPase subunit epsilon